MFHFKTGLTLHWSTCGYVVHKTSVKALAIDVPLGSSVLVQVPLGSSVLVQVSLES